MGSVGGARKVSRVAEPNLLPTRLEPRTRSGAIRDVHGRFGQYGRGCAQRNAGAAELAAPLLLPPPASRRSRSTSRRSRPGDIDTPVAGSALPSRAPSATFTVVCVSVRLNAV